MKEERALIKSIRYNIIMNNNLVFIMKNEISFILAIIIIYTILNLVLIFLGYANGDFYTDYFFKEILFFNLLASILIISSYINHKRKKIKITKY
jgi:hypothetical protein